MAHLGTLNSTSDAKHFTPENFDCPGWMVLMVSPLRKNAHKADCQPVTQQVGCQPEPVTQQVGCQPECMSNESLFVLVAAALIIGQRFLGCKICLVAAYAHLAVPVCGQGGETTVGGLDISVVRGLLWGLAILILIILAVCYRFRIWWSCYEAAHKYIAVSTCDQSTSIVMVETLAETTTEEKCPPVQNSSELEKVYPDIGVKDFINHVKRLKVDSDHGFSHEFLEITEASKNNNFPVENFSMEKNKIKNRYVNIAVYDHSRVILRTDESSPDQTDYINASYVHGYKKPQAYIATQGPLPQTVSDFWRMVWEQNSNVIVMITNLVEKGMTKCEQYWPTKGETTYGNLMVQLLSTEYRPYYIIRIFQLADKKCCSVDSASVRTVYQYHYTQWPDHGVPDYSLPVLSFVQKSAARSRPEDGPTIVHCSAGVGRTGTYILIDSMIAQIMDKRSVNVPGFVRDIRRQRIFLVQTEDQYKFIHEVLVEFLLANGSTEVSEDQMSGYLLQLGQPFQSRFQPYISHASLLERQFQLITEYAPKDFEHSAALESFNQSKNRTGSILPVGSSRVLLPVRPGDTGSDYINATFLQGYTKAAEFIVTQHPAENTVGDFWRMVWQVQSPVIVCLSSLKDKDNKQFWPSECTDKTFNTGSFCIRTKSESIPNLAQDFETLQIVVDFKEGEATLLTRIMIVKDWPYRNKKLRRVFDPIAAAHSYLRSAKCGPVVVVDRFGAAEAGTFCALWTLRDQLLSERCADFYQVCKLYNYKRPGIFKSQENYLFLHNAVAALCKHLQTRYATKHDFCHHNALTSHDLTCSSDSISKVTVAADRSEESSTHQP